MFKIKKGLDLPISGAPVQEVKGSPSVKTCALLGHDYIGLKPTMAVKEGDQVAAGQLLFTDKKNPSLRVVAPISGTVTAINRGHKRVLLSLVIENDGQNRTVEFESYKGQDVQSLSTDDVKTLLVESGLWASFRNRPFGQVPSHESDVNAIFVTAIDTHPLAADPAVIIGQNKEAFAAGLEAVKKLTQGKVYLCTKPGAAIQGASGVEQAQFDGPHPAGLVGTHIHFLSPVSEKKSVWHLNYQDLIAIGRLFKTGKYDTRRVISLAGPQVEQPSLVEVPQGANLEEIAAGKTKAGENRLISGSVLGGAHNQGLKGYLGRYHLQVSVLLEGRERGFMEYLSPGTQKHSVAKIYLSQFAKALRLPMTTTTNGSQRAMVPIGTFEEVVPLDILPTQLLRAIVVGDLEGAIELGALELEEEDLALCTYACPGKYEYGPILRDVLTQIQLEG
ncbi:MAG: Na(+)-translocating NADH-quinone reductase subunit A [Pseudomonadota bacterium]|nr:NADH:ubiquinone reductase (Na(+)-transporting) subunit A [Gammaproteobacteria bacterium]MEC8011357.1 Na(+)-translocating NADH-quinone reductase subunit A [Pseudomonadota bacterium]HBF06899.1 NADH:ubiquinone reductase (Na(+)-transporting) subunit A [Gammaproteobacteria bacterium]|tara:strand:- start:53544 stop:54884 length:1341 start_codon:yes stop_codon:yes gene_type:complete